MRVRMTALGMALAAWAAAGAASAHGPTRQKVTQSVEINAPAAKVWGVMGNFQDMGWVPAVEKTEGTGGNQPGTAKRTVTVKGGGQLKEELTKYDAGEFSYTYYVPYVDVKVLPVANYSSTITVVPEGDDKSKVEWRGAFYRGYENNDPPPELNDEAAVKAVTNLYQSGLAALKQRVEAGS